MEAVEEEFLAEREHVQIIPNFSHDKLYLIAGDVGPFVAGIPCSVPLWLAVNLRQRGKCRLLPPAWMEAEALAAKKEEEMQTKVMMVIVCRPSLWFHGIKCSRSCQVFTKMGSENYMAVAQLLLTTAPHDVPNAHLVRTLIKDIWDLRIAKLRSSVAEFIKQSGRHARLHHLTPMELHSVR
ncbi:hypothetical protein HAZT_HAZT006632 [Hyalella azteca]|uniref:DNA replication complex GINS protein PSF2 n=1 Tax=Hyalella azteca TaxID=294128 RepID=A0A6A0HAT9_HYAAZ|nr:hypothetical protein HAZT_HAZT006632 [Hyalella azteca]